MAGPRILFAGLGKMGLPMATRLCEAGFDVRGLDADDAATARFQAAGGAPAAEGEPPYDILIAMLPNDAIVRDALLGEGALVPQLVSDGLVIDMSSCAPEETHKTAAELSSRGLAMVDAPVSGGVARAEKGDLAVIVGGSADDVARATPVLEPLARSIIHAGPIGAGHAAKALNNFVSASGLVATCRALIVAERFGIDAETMTDVLNGSSGKTNTSEAKLKPFILSEAYNSGFAMALMAKDIGIAKRLAAHVGADATAIADAHTLWAEASAALGPGADHTEMHRYLRATAMRSVA